MTSDYCYMYQGTQQQLNVITHCYQQYKIYVDQLAQQQQEKMDNLDQLVKKIKIEYDEISSNKLIEEYQIQDLNKELEKIYIISELTNKSNKIQLKLQQKKKQWEGNLEALNDSQIQSIDAKYKKVGAQIKTIYENNTEQVKQQQEDNNKQIKKIKDSYNQLNTKLNLNFDEKKISDKKNRLEQCFNQFQEKMLTTEQNLTITYRNKYDLLSSSIRNMLKRSQDCIQKVESQHKQIEENLHTLQQQEQQLQKKFSMQQIELLNMRTQLQDNLQKLQVQIDASTKQYHEFNQNKEYNENIINSKATQYKQDVPKLQSLKNRLDYQKELIDDYLKYENQTQMKIIEDKIKNCEKLIEQRQQEYNRLEELKQQQKEKLSDISQSIDNANQFNKQQESINNSLLAQYCQKVLEKQDLHKDLEKLQQLCSRMSKQ